MKHVLPISVAWLALCCSASLGAANEEPFLKTLAGDWTGHGSMKRTTSSSPINLDCSFKSRATGQELSMNGTCRGLIVVSKAVSAEIKTTGSRYAGRYIGTSGGVSALSGSRAGNAIKLDVRWSKIINGDRNANMTIQRVDDNSIRITTVDRDPQSGKQVVTSQIDLDRR